MDDGFRSGITVLESMDFLGFGVFGRIKGKKSDTRWTRFEGVDLVFFCFHGRSGHRIWEGLSSA